MKLSATVFDLVPVLEIVTPWKLLPEITLPVEAVLPPIVLLVAPPKIPIPTLLGKAAVPAGIGADQVVLNLIQLGAGAADADA